MSYIQDTWIESRMWQEAVRVPEEDLSRFARKGGPPVGHVSNWGKVCNADAECLC
ncbi:hypothetical protein NP493_246g01002 [Ridgeia piscesae]|uniref:Uncharacterized protein n=1 Tax=Ridgeia piscesae TaxID=27915 RepID=A0AAD9NZ13_RIDPI|nr:hypothetical protein NP493_246g01002 [Ridgeia piscesae]